MLTFAQIGFIVIDVAYAAVVVNYAMQCQLLVYSISNIVARIRSKATTIDGIIKVRRHNNYYNYHNITARRSVI